MRTITLTHLAAWLLVSILLFAAISQAASFDTWQMKQRDMHNTGRADYFVPPERLNDTFFDAFSWQKPAPGSPGQGYLSATSMVYYPGSGPDFADLVLGTYHWPKGVLGLDMHDGSLFWQGNPSGGESIARMTPAFSNDGSTIYVVNDATSSTGFPNGHPLMAFASNQGPGSFWHNGNFAVPDDLRMVSPTIGPGGLIYLHSWYGGPSGGFDTGTEIVEDWSAASSIPAHYSDPAIYSLSFLTQIMQGDRDGTITCWNREDGEELWSVEGPGTIDASMTIDPDWGASFVPSGDGSIWVTGLDVAGYPLWSSTAMLVYEYIPGTNNPQRAQSTGCLSHDAATYYFQTNSNEGDGCLYAINTSDGSLKWSYMTGSLGWEIASSCPIVTPNGVIVVGNNQGDTYLALLDEGSSATLLDSYAVNPDGVWGGHAVASATLSADGFLYLPLRTYWTQSNGDGDTPTSTIESLFCSLDLSADIVVYLPKPVHQMAFALDNAVQVFWDEIDCSGDDFGYYAIYRDTAPFSDAAGMTPIATIDNMALTEHLDDTAVNGTSYWYAVTTVAALGPEETVVSPIGPRTPFHANDLQVVSISRTPRYQRYCPEYTTHEITEPGGFGPYTFSAAMSLGCGQDENTQRWPAMDDVVTYTATVRNRGTTTIYDSMDGAWTVDDAFHDSASEMLFFEPNDTATFATTLAWDGLSHELGFELIFTDDRPGNNSLVIDTRSVAYFSCIERSRLEVFREDTVNYPEAGTDDFIDWLNMHMATMNEMLATAGSDKRVHYDSLPVIGDHEVDPAVEEIEFAIFPFRYATGDGSLRTTAYYRSEVDIDYGLLHEWAHQLGLIDLYRLNLEPWMNQVNGESYRSGEGLMMSCSDFISEHSARAMNSWIDLAHGYYGQYLYSLPEHVMLRITDMEGSPMTDAQVRIYQKVDRPGEGEVLSNQVKFSGVTNQEGEWILPNVEIHPMLVPACPSGDTLNDNPFGYVHVVGNNGLFLIEVEHGGLTNYAWLDIVQVNNAYWEGQTGTAVFEFQLEFAEYMHSLPHELTELNAHQWSGHGEMGGQVVLTDDTGSVMVGDASIKYETDGGWDTWMRYPGSGNASWNMSDLQGFEFWVYAENENFSFQNQSPWILLKCANGSYEYHATSELLNSALDNWVHCSVPAAGNANWDLTVHDSPDMSQVQSIEFHADTWGDTFTLWIDGFIFDLGIISGVGDLPGPMKLVLGQNVPNPFNPMTTIEFTLTGPTPVRLVVYNVAGRRVRVLADQPHAAGDHTVVWDGCDDSGRQQVSGVYFYRLETGTRTMSRKMLLLK